MFVEDIAFLLTDEGYPDIFFSTRAQIPDGDGPYISLIETGGLVPLRTHNRKITPAYQRPAAQVVVRAKSYLVARNRALGVYAVIFEIRNEYINNVWYQDVIPLQEPFDAGTDDQGRAKVIFNIRCVKRPT